MSIAKTNAPSAKHYVRVVAEERDFDLPTTRPRQTVSFGTPPIRMKNILVTGANSGIGLAIAEALVAHNRFIADACDWVHEMKDGLLIASHPHGQRISV